MSNNLQYICMYLYLLVIYCNYWKFHLLTNYKLIKCDSWPKTFKATDQSNSYNQIYIYFIIFNSILWFHLLCIYQIKVYPKNTDKHRTNQPKSINFLTITKIIFSTYVKIYYLLIFFFNVFIYINIKFYTENIIIIKSLPAHNK